MTTHRAARRTPDERASAVRLPLAYRAVLLAALLLLAWNLFWQLMVLLFAILLTVIVALPLTAATDRLCRHHVPRPIGASGSALVALAAVAGVFTLLVPTLAMRSTRSSTICLRSSISSA